MAYHFHMGPTQCTTHLKDVKLYFLSLLIDIQGIIKVSGLINTEFFWLWLRFFLLQPLGYWVMQDSMEVFTPCDYDNITNSYLTYYKQKQIQKMHSVNEPFKAVALHNFLHLRP